MRDISVSESTGENVRGPYAFTSTYGSEPRVHILAANECTTLIPLVCDVGYFSYKHKVRSCGDITTLIRAEPYCCSQVGCQKNPQSCWTKPINCNADMRALMQKGTTDRRGRSHPPQCTTLREDSHIVRMANHRRLRRQWCDERRMWMAECNEVVFTDESRIYLQHHDVWILVWRHRGERMLKSSVMHRHTGLAPDIMIDLLPWPSRCPDRSPIENMWSMVAQRLTQIAPQLPHQINFGNVWKVLGLLYRKNTSKVSLNQCRGMWRSPTITAALATDSGRNHTSQKSINLII
ncbi:transposable element Tcb1 transposase [Trichonephila clavipes]|nr:transposable element Tcb1 transposase [Trichonephila clavipes]